ncbi:MAG TPA: CPBP family glutamic-type intramembrane protease [Acidobacteriaceae bacterium]|jgi:hypothetical protein
MNSLALTAEFAVLFVLLPLAFRFSPIRLPPLPFLWAAALYCYLVLRRDASFATPFWNFREGLAALPSVLILFALVAAVMILAVRQFAPRLLFNFPRTRPGIWALVMALYPVLSVYPQGIVYRAFLLHRYRGFPTALGLQGGRAAICMILLSAVAFAFMHIVFRNTLAVSLTFAGGLLFAWRYLETQSLAILRWNMRCTAACSSPSDWASTSITAVYGRPKRKPETGGQYNRGYGKFPEGVGEGEIAQAVFFQGKRPSPSLIETTASGNLL